MLQSLSYLTRQTSVDAACDEYMVSLSVDSRKCSVQTGMQESDRWCSAKRHVQWQRSLSHCKQLSPF